jgi:hypothetical protein
MYEKIVKVLRPVLIAYHDFVTKLFKIFKNIISNFYHLALHHDDYLRFPSGSSSLSLFLQADV